MEQLYEPHSTFRSLQTSVSIWESINFKSVTTYNLEAPAPWVAFLIGGVSANQSDHSDSTRFLNSKSNVAFYSRSALCLPSFCGLAAWS